MRLVDTSDLWWKNAVIYCVDVDKYLDHDGDGDGDLQGLARRIDYLVDLGVSCLWLMPIYPTPDLDNGYDVADFYGVDPRVGSHGDLVELIRAARDRGIRVIADLVLNHTSDRHPWFRSARTSRDSPYRDYYVWRDEIPDDPGEPMFPGTEDGVWEWEEKTRQYYLHSFYRHQPDLNVANPAVQTELAKIVGFWLQLGISGFRFDAVPSFVDSDRAGADAEGEHNALQVLRAFAERRSAGSILLGEVNLPHAEQLGFFGADGARELHMQFDFPGNQALYLSLARQDPAPLAALLSERPGLDVASQWANFVRNHDELTLDQLTDDERDEVFEAFAPDPDQRIFGRGIRRRLPSMLGGDPRRIRMVYSLMFTLPGTPVLFYGEEIGMGENLHVPGRDAVRTPMQWTPDGGFSAAPPRRHPLPMPDGAYGPRHVNVEDQRADPDSLWHHVSDLARSYRSWPEIGWGSLEILDGGAPRVLVHAVTADLGTIIGVHNFAEEAATVTIPVPDAVDGTVLVDLRERSEIAVEDGQAVIDVPAYGAHRLRVCAPGESGLR